MRIVDFIQRDLILPQLTSTAKGEIIRELATQLTSVHTNLDYERLVNVLSEREALASTAIGGGVAIPHGKLPDLDSIVACVGRARDGVDFDSMDGKPTHIFIVMVAPDNSTGAHLKALARISRIFKSSDFLQSLLEAGNATDMYELLVSEDAKY